MKYILGIVAVGALLGTIAFFNVSPFHDSVMQLAGTSTAGVTFNTAKFAGIAVAPTAPGSNATTSSLYNSDANDRYITSVTIGCENVGTSRTAYSGADLAAWTLTVATSSIANPPTAGSLGLTVGGSALTIGTSTKFAVIASTTAGATNASPNVLNVWPAGTYLAGQFNATNTAACTWGVNYIPS